MNFEIIIVLSGLIFLVLSLATERLKPAVAFFLLILILTISGIISPSEALSGFANEQIAVIIMLIVIADIVKKQGLLDSAFNALFRGANTYKGFLLRMSVYVASVSAFINNTPLAAMMIPHVQEWCRKKRIAPSRLLIPLSYATILGGMITLIGTSTNLIVNGIIVSSGLPSLGIFDFIYVGIPGAAAGILYMFFIGNKLLPVRKSISESFFEKTREYVVETEVQPGSSLAGKSVGQAGLRNLPGLFVVEIIREGQTLAPVTPDEIIRGGDILIFAGATHTIAELITKFPGLSLPKAGHISGSDKSEIVEAVVSNNSELNGKKVREYGFRNRFDGAIIAIHRNGEKISGKIGEVELKAGDLLLIMTGKNFYKLTTEKHDLYLLSKVKELKKPNKLKTTVFVAGLIIAVLLSALNILSLFKGLLIVLAVVALFKLSTLNELKNSIDMNLLLVAAFALGLGKALVNSGTATYLSENVIALAHKFSGNFLPEPVTLLIALYLLTNMLTAFMSNAAAACIVLPVALSLAAQMGDSHLPYVFAVTYAASADFSTPFGYQTNLMVYGPGGYTFRDFVKVGVPLNIIYMIICITILTLIYF